MRSKLLDLASILPILTLKSSFSACWKRTLGRGRDFRGFRGRGRQTIGTAPNSQERGVYEVDFWGWGEAGPGEGAGAGKRQLPDQPGRRRATSPGLRKSAPKIDPLRPPEEQSASNLDPIPWSDNKNNLPVLPRRL